MLAMNKKKLIIIIVVLIGVGLWFGFKFYVNNKGGGGNVPGEISYINATADLILVELPFPDAVVGKVFSVIGKARGTWFFEASFPLELRDKNGKLIANGYAQAEGEWMTENFVPFKGEIKAPESYIGPAILVLKKDNASGLPEHDASISFPITVEY